MWQLTFPEDYTEKFRKLDACTYSVYQALSPPPLLTSRQLYLEYSKISLEKRVYRVNVSEEYHSEITL